jgi:hypothetical protein
MPLKRFAVSGKTVPAIRFSGTSEAPSRRWPCASTRRNAPASDFYSSFQEGRMSSTNEPFYTYCSNCKRETFWITVTSGSPGSYGYHCNSCGKLAKKGEEGYEAIAKRVKEMKGE